MKLRNGFINKISLTCFIFLITCNISFSQWIYQNVPTDISHLLSIDFSDSHTGVATGISLLGNFSGKAVYSTNAGSTWLPATVPDSSRVLITAQFINLLTGYCSGACNTFFTDKLSEVSNKNFYSYIGQLKYNPHNKNPFAAAGENNKGLFYKTTDGGRRWDTYGNLPDSVYYLVGLNFVNSTTGFATGSFNVYGGVDDRIIKTTDGGLSWIELSMPELVNDLSNIYFTDSNTGYAVGYDVIQDSSRAVILKTTNAGSSWQMQIFADVQNFNDIYFTDWNTGFVIGNQEPIADGNSVVYKTTNAGLNWVSIPLQLEAITLYGVRFVQGSGTGIIYGGVWDLNEFRIFISRTTDYGQSWANHIQNSSNQIAFGSKLLDQENWYVSGGFSAQILHSTNGGVNVTQISNIIPDDFKLSQNFPNPFNPFTVISYQLTVNSFVLLIVYDVVGNEVKTLVNEKQNAGVYEVQFDGNNLPSGIYFYKILAGEFSEVKKMTLIK